MKVHGRNYRKNG